MTLDTTLLAINNHFALFLFLLSASTARGKVEAAPCIQGIGQGYALHPRLKCPNSENFSIKEGVNRSSSITPDTCILLMILSLMAMAQLMA